MRAAAGQAPGSTQIRKREWAKVGVALEGQVRSLRSSEAACLRRSGMKVETMSRDASLALLGTGRVGRLGFVAEGEPYVVPMDYVFEEMCIYAHSLLGHKIRALRGEPRACFQVDRVADDLHWSSVMVHGTYEEITDPGERLLAYRKLLLRFPGLTPVEVIEDHGPPHPDVILFRIPVEAVTGVSSGSEL